MGKYEQIINWIFTKNYNQGDVIVSFNRNELVTASDELGLARIKNLGDIPYSFRFRRQLPEGIQSTAPEGAEWIIVGMGIGEYAFRLAAPGKITPNVHYFPTKIPDATPEIVRHYAPGTDEQALLTRARYNRLIDVFTGLTCYSVQNHLRTTVNNTGENNVALLELAIREEDEILRLNIVDEKHYQLVSRTKIFNVELEVLKESEAKYG